ncbi:MAG TPA: YibE/F family protein, partial [Pedococcus sp.]|nr:YibE/F family protein [Pedococcus sp.]
MGTSQGHAHTHLRSTNGASPDVPAVVKRGLVLVVVLLAAASLAGMWALRPTGHGRPTVPNTSSSGVRYLPGVVGSLSPLDCSQVGAAPGKAVPGATVPGRAPSSSVGGQCGRAIVRLDNGYTVTVDVPPEVVRAGVGTALVVMDIPGQSGSPYSYYDMDRGKPLVLLALLFCVVVVAVARMRGLRALLGLAVAALVVGKFLIPALLEGHDPVALGLATSGAIMIVVLYLAHGANLRTTTALLGTMAGVAITAALGSAAVS